MHDPHRSTSVKIQKPTIGRVVEFTAFRGHEEKERDAYPATITKVHDDGVVDLVTFGRQSVYFQTGIKHSADGDAMTWRYPPRSDETIEVSG